MPSPEKKLEI